MRHLRREKKCPIFLPGRDILLIPILKVMPQSPEFVGIGPPVALAALLVVPLKRVATPPRGFAAVAEERAKVPLVPLKSLVEVAARHVTGRKEGRQQGHEYSNPSSQECARLFSLSPNDYDDRGATWVRRQRAREDRI